MTTKSIQWLTYLADIIPTDIRFMIPSYFKWMFREKIQNRFDRYTLQPETATKQSYLFQHRSPYPNIDPNVNAVLFLHGDYSHPCTTLHMGDIAQQQNKVVFSLFIPSGEIKAGRYGQHLKEAIGKLQNVIGDQKMCLRELVLIGHSRGATEAVYQTYVEKETPVTGVIAIAGRLKFVEMCSRMPCKESLKPMLNDIHKAIGNSTGPLTPPLYQIVASRDSCIDPCAAFISEENKVEIQSGHAGILYHSKSLQQLATWLDTHRCVKSI